MNKADKINEILEINESYQLPDKLMKTLLNENDKNNLFDKFFESFGDIGIDFFTDYFQEEHANRKAMMQDYTPKELTQLLADLSGDFESVIDICAGIGGLTLALWEKNPNASFYCEELSERALPLLLFNLSVKNINAYVMNCDSLERKLIKGFKLTRNEKYSIIEEIIGKS